MNELISHKEIEFYKTNNLNISEFFADSESKDYHACSFQLNTKAVIYRKAKITPKKVGQFVTFWKRQSNNIIAPFNETDAVDYYVINVQFEDNTGQFVFSKTLLLKCGIISTSVREGKRGFRVYPAWDKPTSNQAIKTQNWQLDYFFSLNNLVDSEIGKSLYL